MRERRRVSTLRRVAAVAAGALLLAACGAEDPEAVTVATADEEAEDTAAVEEEAEPDEQDTAAEDEEPDGAEPGPDSAAEDEEEEVVEEELALGTCDLADTDGEQQPDVDTYEQLTLETNFELELLVADLAADLDELLSGVSDGPTLEGQLADHRVAYAETVEPLREVAPPDGAGEWHGRAMASFDDVCAAIEDGLAGSAEGDDARFEAFVAAVTEFPALINGLHANAACGPFEAC